MGERGGGGEGSGGRGAGAEGGGSGGGGGGGGGGVWRCSERRVSGSEGQGRWASRLCAGQSLNTNQGNSDAAGRQHSARLQESLNPSIPIRAIRTELIIAYVMGLLEEVSIPQYQSGQFGRGSRRRNLHQGQVSIPQYQSGQFGLCSV